MSLPNVLPSDDSRLKQTAIPVVDVLSAEFQEQSRILKACLDAFRMQHGFGRGIAAPQIGIQQRFIALNLGAGSFCMVNPEIVWHSEARFTMWDDCMCFPDTLVKVQRYDSVSVRFLDESGQVQEWHQLKRDLSELLQHEIDHLDGVLALDLAEDQDATVSRREFQSRQAFFEAQVDYVIHPTT